MKRNLDRRVETILPVLDENIKQQIAAILEVYENDNISAWDCQPDGRYVKRCPAEGDPPHAAQQILIQMAKKEN